MGPCFRREAKFGVNASGSRHTGDRRPRPADGVTEWLVKLFQIEEPDGSPIDPNAPGAAIGIDASGKLAEVAFAIGGNALILTDREGFEINLPVPPLDASAGTWQVLFEGARLRAERALARPVTHAAVGVARKPTDSELFKLTESAEKAGLELLVVLNGAPFDRSVKGDRALRLATAAEDMAPRPKAV